MLSNGLSLGPRIVTKLLKPIYTELGALGYLGLPYLDDSFVIGKNKEERQQGISALTKIFVNLGFKVNS